MSNPKVFYTNVYVKSKNSIANLEEIVKKIHELDERSFGIKDVTKISGEDTNQFGIEISDNFLKFCLELQNKIYGIQALFKTMDYIQIQQYE
jgi:hypothetical protein